MLLIARHHIKPNNIMFKDCYDLCKASKLLRNTCLYHIRNYYVSNNYSLKIKVDNKLKYIYHFAYLYHMFNKTKQYRTEENAEINNRYINTKI